MIKRLSPDVQKKIAAGEVITSPASAVKELIENALDANASEIEISVKDGGKKYIKVSDDGEGIQPDELPLAIERFTTSKIEGIEDLRRIKSFGFRGEALASIAAVSRLTIESQTKDYPYGVKLKVEGGEIIQTTEVVRRKGTSVVVENLFFNLPARRAFLKSSSYELRSIITMVKRYALVFPEKRFKLESEGEEIFNFTKKASVKERLKEISPNFPSESVFSIEHIHPLISIFGFLENPGVKNEIRISPMVYVNKRPVSYRIVNRAVESVYSETPNKNPWFMLNFTIKPELLDVNIHPTKREIKFHDEKFLFDFLVQALKKNLAQQGEPHLVYKGSSFNQATQSELLVASEWKKKEELAPAFWQLQNTYILAQIRSGFIIIDQHAAHERILFEEILKKGKRTQQRLLFPLTIQLLPEEFSVFQIIKPVLEQLGVAIKLFSERTIIVEAVPYDSRITLQNLYELFKEFTRSEGEVLKKKEEVAKLLACKAAIKAGQTLSQQEMESLINKLFACENPYFCPHGRPTVSKFTTEEIEKRFGRK